MKKVVKMTIISKLSCNSVNKQILKPRGKQINNKQNSDKIEQVRKYSDKIEQVRKSIITKSTYIWSTAEHNKAAKQYVEYIF